MNTFDMATMLREAGDCMRLGLRSRLVPHPGERGISRETILRTFLADHLPRKFVVDTGFVFDCTGRCSEQMDIIIADANNCPLFQDAGGRHFFPAEGVVAVGQVRSSATSQNAWHSALDNLESAKHLDRSGKGQSINKLTGEALEPRDNHLHQMFSFFFVVGDTLKPETARDLLVDYLSKRDPHLWPNVCLAFDRYLLTFCCDGGVCPNPMCARGIALQIETPEVNTLQRFYLLLAQAIEVTAVSGLPYSEYLSRLGPWQANIIYSATSDPPPLLSAVLGR